MADTMSTAGSAEMNPINNGVVVDMASANLLQHNLHNALATRSQSFAGREDTESEKQTSKTKATVASCISPTNFSGPQSITTFRCERCDNFETDSRASLLMHVVQCISNSANIKSEESNLGILSASAMARVEQSDSGCADKLPADPQQFITIASSVPAEACNKTASNISTSPSSLSPRKVFECDVCNMKFSNGANMRRHKMRHTGVKPYECRVCQKRFFRKDHLAEHFTTHTKTLPYHCPICNRGFQRQIAMRAHFQNEHVGQHDLVKTCPLCSYRAGSMKSLRIHFFNRHGIDLDNPGTSNTSSLLLALESQASQVVAAAAAAGFVPSLNAVAAAAAAANANINPNMASHQSDSGESLRSMENSTPPMHFLSPHVEISTLSDNGTELFNGNTLPSVVQNEPSDCMATNRETVAKSPVTTAQDYSIDCNAKSLPSSTSNASSSPKVHHHEKHIMPSISLIPIKQEPLGDNLSNDSNRGSQKMGLSGEQLNGGDVNELEFSSSNNKMNSLIKVSPLKSLLREDLKRRICAKANNRVVRNAAALENNNAPTSNSSSCGSIPICNGTITSTGQETEAVLMNRKQILTCLFCGIDFPDETLYFLHKGCHCESNPWKCNICGEQCNNVYEFNSHLLSKSHQ